MRRQALAIVLLAVFFIQAAFAMVQDWSTSRVMASIKDMLPEHCKVTRDGQLVDLAAEKLVPGDVVSIKSGNKLPADLRFVQISSDANFDRSVLTGESRPVAATVHHTDSNYLETHNIGLQGTHCIVGSGTGIVVDTGDRTVFGRIATLTNEPSPKMTTLEKEVLYFVLFICAVMFTMIAVVLVVWWVLPARRVANHRLISVVLQGRVAQARPPRLDQRADPHRQLRQRRRRLHSRGPPHCHHGGLDNHGKHDEEEQGALQVPQNRRDVGLRVRHLLRRDGHPDAGTLADYAVGCVAP